MRVADKYAHRRMKVTVLGAGRLKDGSQLLYIRRIEEGISWSSGYGYLFDMLRLDPRTGTWTETAAPMQLREFITTQPVGTIGRASGKHVEAVEPRTVHEDRVIVVSPPENGWLWQRGNLSAAEAANVRFNYGLPDDSPLPCSPLPGSPAPLGSAQSLTTFDEWD